MGKKIKKGFISGALVLMLFGFLSKIVGAIYRIPLTGIIGAEGMGLYQMVFPLYTLMLTISSSGLPSSISKLISENVAKNNYKQADRVLKVSFILLVCFSIVCFLIVMAFAGVFASLQGNIDAKICYFGLAPAIIFVGIISGFRGYFQGLQCMSPSAISGFIEQIIKMGFGLFFASKFVKIGVSYGVLGALIGISISELMALIYLFIHYLVTKKKRKHLYDLDSGYLLSKKETAKGVLSLSIFVTLGGLIMPLTMLIDSGVVINILKSIGYSQTQATSLFGLQTGTVGSIINMPVVLSLGVATAILPCVSSRKSKGDMEGVKAACSKALFLTIILALPASIGVMAFAEPCIKLLYSGSLTENEIAVASNILEVASIGIFYLAMVQVCSGLLQGLGKFKVPLISLAIGGVIKIILNLVLIRIPEIGILGAEVSTIVCYMVALLINLIVLKKQDVIRMDGKIIVVLLLSILIYFSKYIFKILNISINYYLAFFVTVFMVIVIYFVLLLILYKGKDLACKYFKKQEKTNK